MSSRWTLPALGRRQDKQVPRSLVLVGALVAALFAFSDLARAQTPGESIEVDPLEQALEAFDRAEFAQAAAAAKRALSSQLDDTERAELWRILGLSHYYVNQLVESETAFVEYLKLDTDALLDPALHPQNVVSFFVGVRSRHQAELDKYRPKRETRRGVLMLLPPFGQFENKQRTKGFVLGGTELGLLAISVSSYFVLRSWCDDSTGECPGREDDARNLQVVNIGAGVAFAGVYLYGVVDAYRTYRRWKRSQQSLSGSLTGFVVPTGDGVAAGLSVRF